MTEAVCFGAQMSSSLDLPRLFYDVARKTAHAMPYVFVSLNEITLRVYREI